MELLSDKVVKFVATHPRPENPPAPPPETNDAKTGTDELLRFLRG